MQHYFISLLGTCFNLPLGLKQIVRHAQLSIRNKFHFHPAVLALLIKFDFSIFTFSIPRNTLPQSGRPIRKTFDSYHV